MIAFVGISILFLVIFTSCLRAPKSVLTSIPTIPSSIKENGGVQLIYQADCSGIANNDQKEALDSDVIMMKIRAGVLGASSVDIYELSGNRILVYLTGISDINHVARIIGKSASLEFGELGSDPNSPNIKWRNSLGSWVPATGTLHGKTVELTDAYIKKFATVRISNGQFYLNFSWNPDGSILSSEITQRLIGKPMGMFLGDEAITGADGNIIAPIILDPITTEVEITGLDEVDARQLQNLINAGTLKIPLILIDLQSIPPTKLN
jgi:SecD/SecF fusion protein